MEDRHETGRGDANLLKIWQLERCLQGALYTDERSLSRGRCRDEETRIGRDEEQCGAWPRTPASQLSRPALDRASMKGALQICIAIPRPAPARPGGDRALRVICIVRVLRSAQSGTNQKRRPFLCHV